MTGDIRRKIRDNRLIEILQCSNCHALLKNNRNELLCTNCNAKIPVIDGIPRFYKTTRKNVMEFDEVSIRTINNWTGWRRKNYDYFMKKLEGINKSSVILDIGAGTSPFSALFEPFTTFKVDFEPYRGIDFLTDLNKPLPVANSSFDIVIMSNLLEHIPEPLILLKECHRILKPDGKLIMTVPFLIKVHQAPYDFLRYTEFMLKRLISQAGFQKAEVEKIGNIVDVHSQVSSSLYKYLRKNAVSDTVSKRKLISLCYFIYNYITKTMLKISNFDSEDTIGYPHGYGCVATKQ